MGSTNLRLSQAQFVAQTIQSLAPQFPHLKAIPGYMNWVKGICFVESRFNPFSIGPPVNDQYATEAISAATALGLASGITQFSPNIQNLRLAIGIMQVMGWNLMDGLPGLTIPPPYYQVLKSNGLINPVTINPQAALLPPVPYETSVKLGLLAGMSVLDLKIKETGGIERAVYDYGGGSDSYLSSVSTAAGIPLVFLSNGIDPSGTSVPPPTTAKAC